MVLILSLVLQPLTMEDCNMLTETLCFGVDISVSSEDELNKITVTITEAIEKVSGVEDVIFVD